MEKKATKKVIKKPKTSKPNPKRNKDAKAHTIYGQLKEAMSWREIKPDIKFIRRVIDHLQEWLQEPNNTDIYSFFHYLGIPSQTYYDWCNKFTELQAAHSIAIERLGVRRASHAEYKKHGANPEVIKATLHKYHPVWKDVYEEDKAFKREMKDQNKDDTRDVIVNMYPMTKPPKGQDKDNDKT